LRKSAIFRRNSAATCSGISIISEKIAAEANESDPENLLRSTFLLADVGKLYLLLARAVGLLN
jgi:hypothetical protein